MTSENVLRYELHMIAHQAHHVLCCIIDTNFIPRYFLESGLLTKINF